MPYELSFQKQIEVGSTDEYMNDCCIGGDVVSSWLRPEVEARYADLQADQEDWGWFLWFRKDDVRLAIDIFTDDPDAGDFTIRLTSRRPKWVFFSRVTDTPELEELREVVTGRLEAAGAQNIVVRTVPP